MGMNTGRQRAQTTQGVRRGRKGGTTGTEAVAQGAKCTANRRGQEQAVKREHCFGK